MSVAQTLIEKIVQRHAVGWAEPRPVRAGDFVTVRPAHVMTHDNTSAVKQKFDTLGVGRIADRGQPVFALDHDIQNTAEATRAKHAAIEAFAREQGVDFHPAGRGIGHQLMVEAGYVLPGTLVVASDSHSNMYGALGALGTPVVRTDAAGIWATGTTWWQVPEIVRVTLTGKLPAGVTGKDVIIALCGVFDHDEVLNCAIEFAGPGVASLDIDARLTIANMTTEWGALAGVFPWDRVTRDYLRQRAIVLGQRTAAPARLTPARIAHALADMPIADAGAPYAKELSLDLSHVAPFVAGPDTIKRVQPVSKLAGQRVRIDKAYLMSCVNGRLSDFEAAAAVLADRPVAPGVQLYIAAASAEVEADARARGIWQTLLNAGARPLPPGCGACIGLGAGTLAAGGGGISATNRNFKGRMGHRDAQAYLASPAVVAASAAAGYITGPEGAADASGRGANLDELRATAQCTTAAQPAVSSAVELLPGFPAGITGELLFLPVDNLNTDGIYGKEHTYREDLTPAEMAQVVCANYDPAFAAQVRPGDLLAAGANFGCGSSREQAATALRHAGIGLVIAESFSQTYKRNAFNNGFIVIACPPLIDRLRRQFAAEACPTIRTELSAAVDFERGVIRACDEAYPFAPLGSAAQELIVAGGLEALIRPQLAATSRRPVAAQEVFATMRDAILEAFPEINELTAARLRDQVVAVWTDALETGGWTMEALRAIPFTLLAGDIDIRFLEHVRTGARLSLAVHDVLQDAYGTRVRLDRDTLLAGALLADVGKPIEYVKGPDGRPQKGPRGDLLRHPFSGVGLCWKHGLPDAVMHIVATHSKEGDHVQRTLESIIFHHADFVDFDIACALGKGAGRRG